MGYIRAQRTNRDHMNNSFAHCRFPSFRYAESGCVRLAYSHALSALLRLLP